MTETEPLITRPAVTQEVVGFTCDICDRTWTTDESPHCLSYNELDHTAGYGSQLDTTNVYAVLCDACLFRLMIDHVPGARFSAYHNRGRKIEREQVRHLLQVDRT
jgi:hypothetical protein